MSDSYVLILGREPELSVAEIAAVAARLGVSLEWKTITQQYALVGVDSEPIELFNQLAGTVKLARVLGEVSAAPAAVVEFTRTVLEQEGLAQWYFGFSVYGGGFSWLKQVGMSLKHEAKAAGRRARFVVSREPVLSSVIVAKNKLLPPQGCEFILLPQKDKVIVCRTLQVQQFEDWGERDFGRPERDARVGMLPPKLARLMINLSQVAFTESLLDPFCGSGTVLQEAAVLGYQELWGFDANAAGISRTQANLGWLREQYPELSFSTHITVAPIEHLSHALEGRTFAAIVTEPFLGPPLTGRETPQARKKIVNDLAHWYEHTITVLSHTLAPKGKLIMVWPVVQDNRALLELDLIPLLSKLGLRVEHMLPELVPSGWQRERGSLLYMRANQRVGREIFVLVKI